jgi:hypothetical protein
MVLSEMSVKHWWKASGNKAEVLGEKSAPVLVLRHKFYREYPEIEPGLSL